MAEKVLIVEDSREILDFLETAVKKVMPEFGRDSASNCFQAWTLVRQNLYPIVILDNGIPTSEYAPFPIIDGYLLIPTIKSRSNQTTIIGTSSMHSSQLVDLPKPDFQLDKNSSPDNVIRDLSSLIQEIKMKR